MSYQDFVELLKISTYIWVNLFFLTGTLLTVFIWLKFARTHKKVNDTLDIVQGAAFSLYESFDKRGSQIMSGVGNFVGGLVSGRRRRK